MALSNGPARALAYDRRRGFHARVGSDERYGKNFCMARCNAHKRVQALRTIPLNGVNTADAPLEERWKSDKTNRAFFVIGKPLKVDFLPSQAKISSSAACLRIRKSRIFGIGTRIDRLTAARDILNTSKATAHLFHLP
jgi:hypothetical protein